MSFESDNRFAAPEDNTNIRLKIALLGPCQSGKTRIANKLAGKAVSTSYDPTQGVRILEIDEKFTAYTKDGQRSSDVTCTVELWDVSGNDEFEFAWKPVMKDLNGAIFCFNSTGGEQSRDVMVWCRHFAQHAKLQNGQMVLWAHGSMTKEHNPYKIKVDDKTITIPIQNVHYQEKPSDKIEQQYEARHHYVKLLEKCFAFHKDADTSTFI